MGALGDLFAFLGFLIVAGVIMAAAVVALVICAVLVVAYALLEAGRWVAYLARR